MRQAGLLDDIQRVVIVACGTSYHAGLIAKYVIEQWARIPVEVVTAAEFRYADPIVGPQTLCVAVTQSGETADTLVGIRQAREHGAPVIAITNVVASAITRLADAVLYLQAGPEICVVATKTFVSLGDSALPARPLPGAAAPALARLTRYALSSRRWSASPTRCSTSWTPPAARTI